MREAESVGIPVNEAYLTTYPCKLLNLLDVVGDRCWVVLREEPIELWRESTFWLEERTEASLSKGVLGML